MGSPNVSVNEKNSFLPKSAGSGSKAPVVEGPASRGPRLGSAPKK